MVKQGIEAANEDLRKENESRLMQEVFLLGTIPFNLIFLESFVLLSSRVSWGKCQWLATCWTGGRRYRKKVRMLKVALLTWKLVKSFDEILVHIFLVL